MDVWIEDKKKMLQHLKVYNESSKTKPIKRHPATHNKLENNNRTNGHDNMKMVDKWIFCHRKNDNNIAQSHVIKQLTKESFGRSIYISYLNGEHHIEFHKIGPTVMYRLSL